MNRPILWLGLSLIALLMIIVGCEKTPMDVLIPNQEPRVALSAGPIRDSTNVFIATFNWNASDPDGQVVRFMYAIDDTSSADAWFDTQDFELTLFFTTPDSARPDTVLLGQSMIPLERYIFNGAHTFFLKAVDDDGQESRPASLSFTAETFAPVTNITNPLASRTIDLGPTFTVRWEGNDIDGTEDPVGYSWRLVRVPRILEMTDADVENALFDPNSDGEPWSPFEPRLSVQITNVATPAEYIFGVRALDQAGAVEPRMRTFRALENTNVLLLRAAAEGGRPNLQVSSAVKTASFPTGDVSKKTFQIPANTDVLFSWAADATAYGGTIASYSYGVDLEDLEDSNPGWAPESANLTQVRLNFTIPDGSPSQEHLFFVRVRDDVGTTLIADVSLIVIPLQFDRDVIYVDDWGKDNVGLGNIAGNTIFPDIDEPYCTSSATTTGDGRAGVLEPTFLNPGAAFPQDTCHDETIRVAIEDALTSIGLEDWVVDRYEALDPIDGKALSGEVEVDTNPARGYYLLTGPVTLEALSRYKIVIWNHRASVTSALGRMNRTGEDNFLAVYLEAGGKVWVTGTATFSHTRFDDQGVGLGIFGFDGEDFPWRFLKVQSAFEGITCADGCFRASGSNARWQFENGFDGGLRTNRAINEGWPELETGRAPYGDGPSKPDKGVPNCEGMVVPNGLDINSRLVLFGGRLDTLYHYQSNGRLEVGRSSWMDDAATGMRYTGPGQGPLLHFGFPLFYFPNDQLVEMLASGINWLRMPQ